jgi:hypothetical protein
MVCWILLQVNIPTRLPRPDDPTGQDREYAMIIVSAALASLVAGAAMGITFHQFWAAKRA